MMPVGQSVLGQGGLHGSEVVEHNSAIEPPTSIKSMCVKIKRFKGILHLALHGYATMKGTAADFPSADDIAH